MNGNGVVLIVDDHASLARSLVSLLNASGFEAQAVHSGAEALAFVRSHEGLAHGSARYVVAGYVRP
jgi:CheY-like chemotaxis protein